MVMGLSKKTNEWVLIRNDNSREEAEDSIKGFKKDDYFTEVLYKKFDILEEDSNGDKLDEDL